MALNWQPNSSRKAQFSLEHLLMTGVIMLALIPVVYLFYSYARDSSSQIMDTRINVIGNNIINNAESVYYLGEPSKITIEENMPEGVYTMIILQDSANKIYELVFTTINNETTVFSSRVPINGSFDTASATQGPKTITLEALGAYVNITIK